MEESRERRIAAICCDFSSPTPLSGNVGFWASPPEDGGGSVLHAVGEKVEPGAVVRRDAAQPHAEVVLVDVDSDLRAEELDRAVDLFAPARHRPFARRARRQLCDPCVAAVLVDAPAREIDPGRYDGGAAPLTNEQRRAVGKSKAPHRRVGCSRLHRRRRDRHRHGVARRRACDHRRSRHRHRRLARHLGRSLRSVVVERELLERQVLLRCAGDLVRAQRLQLRKVLRELLVAVARFVLRQRLRLAQGGLQLEDQLRLDRVLRQLQLVRVRPVGSHPLHDSERPLVDLGAVLLVERRLNREDPDIVEGEVRRVDRARGIRADHARVEARRASPAEDDGEHVERELILGGDTDGLPTEHRIALLDVGRRTTVPELGLRRLLRAVLLVELGFRRLLVNLD